MYVCFCVTGTNVNDAMTLHWWMHWFWVTAQIVGKFFMYIRRILAYLI